MWRLCAAVSFAFAACAGDGAHAGDRSVSQSVTNAFETVVIDARTAASKAAEAAKGVLAPDERKKKRKAKPTHAADGKADAAPAKPDRAGTTAGVPQKNGAPQKDGTKSADPAGSTTAAPADASPKKPAIATEWPALEVELARARCTQLLKGVDAVTIPEAPFRQGDCGTLAPVRLVSIGKNPEIALSPPPVVTCDLVVALTKWMKEDVQPAARRHLGSDIIRMDSMSDYSCRMAYGRIGNKLSEHGKANALDIRGFTTRKGHQAVVLAGWGETKRDVAKRMAAAKTAAAKAEAIKVAAEKASRERAEAAQSAAKAENTGTPLPRKTLVEGLPRKADDPSFAHPAAVTVDGALGMAPTRLGGPKDKDAAPKSEDKKGAARKAAKETAKQRKGPQPDDAVAALPPPDAAAEAVKPAPKTPTSRFLHEVHAAACQIFGTTLGPEANEAHRNHFHVDMAERKVRKICD